MRAHLFLDATAEIALVEGYRDGEIPESTDFVVAMCAGACPNKINSVKQTYVPVDK